MLVDENDGGRRRTGRTVNDRLVSTTGLERKTDPEHRYIPPALYNVALTRLGGGPDMIPGPKSQSDRGTQTYAEVRSGISMINRVTRI